MTPSSIGVSAGLAHALSPSEEALLGAAGDVGHVLLPISLALTPLRSQVADTGSSNCSATLIRAVCFHSELCVTLKTDTAEGKQCPLFPHPLTKEQLVFTCKEIWVIW